MNEVKHIYIVLTRTQSSLGRVIRHVTNDTYTHVTISFDKTLEKMWGFGRKYPENPFYGVFRCESLTEGYLGQHKELPGAILELDVTEEQFQSAQDIVEDFIENKDKYSYNILGLITSTWDVSVQFEDSFFCSEFVYHVLRESNIINLRRLRSFVRPQSFMETGFRLIYEGDLKKLGNNTDSIQMVNHDHTLSTFINDIINKLKFEVSQK